MNAILINVVASRDQPIDGWSNFEYQWLVCCPFDARTFDRSSSPHQAGRGANTMIRIHGEKGDMLVKETLLEIYQLCDGRAISVTATTASEP